MSFLLTKMFKIIVLASVALTGTALELTPDTWDEQTVGKTVFLKFFAPWCGHCKAMKPDWDSLMEDYASSESVLVADIDCIGAGKPLCDEAGVQGFPTIKYGDPANLEAYKGGRDLSTLKAFASELKPGCDVATLENCDDDQKKAIEGSLALSEEELLGHISTYEKTLNDIEETFKAEVQKLQTTFQGLNEKKSADVAELTHNSGIGITKSVLKHKQSKTEL